MSIVYLVLLANRWCASVVDYVCAWHVCVRVCDNWDGPCVCNYYFSFIISICLVADAVAFVVNIDKAKTQSILKYKIIFISLPSYTFVSLFFFSICLYAIRLMMAASDLKNAILITQRNIVYDFVCVYIVYNMIRCITVRMRTRSPVQMCLFVCVCPEGLWSV